MCANYTLKPNMKDLEVAGEHFRVPDSPWAADRVLPGRLAPVIVESACKVMKFSLLPKWSKEPKVKFATHNARIESVLEKPTWRRPFEGNHCLVPMDAFIEPIYEGDLSGNMVKFQAPQTIFAAGIFDEWVSPESGEVIESFAILTKDPTPFVKQAGHDRQPIFLMNPSDQKDWIANKSRTPKDWQSYLATVPNQNEFTLEIDRKLKSRK